MKYLVSTEILFELVGSRREPVISWANSKNPSELCFSEMSYAWINVTLDEAEALTRSQFTANISKVRELFRESGSEEVDLPTEVINAWRNIYVACHEVAIDPEEIFVIASAVAFQYHYVTYAEPFWSSLSKKLRLEVVELGRPIDGA